MKIAIHDAETEHLKHKTFPNYALMKISAWHKSQGDAVEWWNALNQYDRANQFLKQNCHKCHYLRRNTKNEMYHTPYIATRTHTARDG